MGVVCAKHDQYYEKECQWCEPAEIASDMSPPIMTAEEFNAHIAEAAAQAPTTHPLLIRWPKDKAT